MMMSESRAPAILVIEDDSDIRITLVDLLEGRGYSVRSVENGLQALEELSSFVPDLILSDATMPHLDGIKLSGKIRGLPGLSHVPLVLMSAGNRTLPSRPDRTWDDFLAKPFSVSDLEAVVSKYVDRVAQLKPA